MRPLVRVLVLAAFVAAFGCNSYNFSPVGHCLIQPGTRRFKLSSVATADILFVVDDSSSMAGDQANLARNFKSFVDTLNATNTERVGIGLEPIDFHIAITTTSVYLNTPLPNVSCRDDCIGYAGSLVCCGNATLDAALPRSCAGGASCGPGFTCRTDCQGGSAGSPICCDASLRPETSTVACTNKGDPCGALLETYTFPSGVIPCYSSHGNADCAPGFTCRAGCGNGVGNLCCDANGNPEIGLACLPGVATAGALYPHGDFVSATVGGKPNPRVLHFDASLYEPTLDQPAIDRLIAQFQQNVLVGTCGSGQDQELLAMRLAIQKALAGQQTDVDDAGKPVKALWPHPNSKLIVVIMGDEDDCSSPEDRFKGIVLVPGEEPDACVQDAARPPDQQKLYPVAEFAAFLEGLGRPLGAGFLVSANCSNGTCTPGICCDNACSIDEGWGNDCTTDECGSHGAANRLLALRDQLVGKADVVTDSICDAQFSTILQEVADIVKPPVTLQLPTQPAASEVALLRVVDENGNSRLICRGPAPAGTPLAAAQAGYDWWFVDDASAVTPSTRSVTSFIYINHSTHHCEANPGETYSADYLGLVPAGGCASVGDCVSKLGGTAADWTCTTGGQPRGTCLCTGAN